MGRARHALDELRRRVGRARVVTINDFGQEVWPKEKLALLERAGVFLAEHDVAMMLVCQHPRCVANPTLRRVDVAPGSFVLACEHKLRLCEDRRTR